MKKFVIYICLFVLATLFFSPIFTSKKCVAAVIDNHYETLVSIFNKFCFEDQKEVRYNRLAGSDGEKAVADYLVEKIRTDAPSFILGGINNSGVSEFYSYTDHGTQYKSQNVIAYKKGVSNEKIIITVSYDNFYGYELSENQVITADGFNLSLCSILSALLLIDRMDDVVLPYTIEFVFLGSENYNSSGSQSYIYGINDEEKELIKSVINIGSVGNNSQLYLYGMSVNKNVDKLFAIYSSEKVAKYNPTFDGTVNLVDLTNNNLGQSDVCKKFEDLGLVTFNMFACEKFNILAEGSKVNYENDTILFAKEKYQNNFLDTCYETSNYLFNLLSSKNIESALNSLNHTNWLHKNIHYISLFVSIAFLVIVYYLSRQYYDKMKNNAINQLNSMAQIEHKRTPQ